VAANAGPVTFPPFALRSKVSAAVRKRQARAGSHKAAE
jgi:hypothetical protein